MPIRCANCGGFFTADEVLRIKPPLHPWQLTAAGEQAVTANQLQGDDQPPCPNCGRKSLQPR